MPFLDFIVFINIHHLEISFFLLQYSTLILFLFSLFGGVLLANTIKFEKYELGIIAGILFSWIAGYFVFHVVILQNHFDRESKNQNFYYGCMTYYTTTEHQAKGQRKISYTDYFVINNTFVDVPVRSKNSTVGTQIIDFNTLLKSHKCYPVRYMKFKFLFYTTLEVYDFTENPNQPITQTTHDQPKAN